MRNGFHPIAWLRQNGRPLCSREYPRHANEGKSSKPRGRLMDIGHRRSVGLGNGQKPLAAVGRLLARHATVDADLVRLRRCASLRIVEKLEQVGARNCSFAAFLRLKCHGDRAEESQPDQRIVPPPPPQVKSTSGTFSDRCQVCENAHSSLSGMLCPQTQGL